MAPPLFGFIHPTVVMVEMLGDVIEDRRVAIVGGDDHFFDRLAFVFGAFHQIICIGDIGRVMLVVVIFEGLAGKIRLQSVVGIRQIFQGEGHNSLRTLDERSLSASAARA
jgi:hypothetical protein